MQILFQSSICGTTTGEDLDAYESVFAVDDDDEEEESREKKTRKGKGKRLHDKRKKKDAVSSLDEGGRVGGVRGVCSVGGPK